MKLIRPITVGDAGAFSRASGGTYYDKDGVLQVAGVNVPRLSYDPDDLTKPPAWLMEPAATNLVTYSQAFDNAAWSKISGAVMAEAAMSPNGGANADTFTSSGADGAVVSASFTPMAAVTHNASVWMRSSTPRTVRLFAIRISPFLAVESLTCAVTAAWTRFNFDFVPADLTAHRLQIGGGYTLPSGAAIDLFGAQVTEGAGASSYFGTTSAAATRAADVNTLQLLSNVPEPDTGDPPAWSATSLVTAGTVLRTSSHQVFKAVLGGATAAMAFTASNANASVNWTNHGLVNGTPVAFTNAGGALPAALTAGATYYVVSAAANTFGVAAAIGGAGITLATAGTGVHAAQPNPNYGKDPTLPANAAYWVKVGPTNRWAMFDQLSNTATIEADVLATMVDVNERIDTVALLNVNAASARVIVTDAAAGVVYDEVHSLVSTDGVDNAWEWCFSPIERVADLTIEDLPPYYSPSVQVILSAPGETPSCGMCLMGLSYLIGGTQYGAQVGIQDYSVKSTDDFGNIEITARQYAKRGSFSARFPKGRTDSVVKRLTEFRTTPALWLGSGEYQSTAIFGFYKDFSVLIDQLSHSLCEIEIEGLT